MVLHTDIRNVVKYGMTLDTHHARCNGTDTHHEEKKDKRQKLGTRKVVAIFSLRFIHASCRTLADGLSYP